MKGAETIVSVPFCWFNQVFVTFVCHENTSFVLQLTKLHIFSGTYYKKYVDFLNILGYTKQNRQRL